MDRLNHQTAALRVCVDRAEGGRLSGRVVSRRLTRPMAFTDIGSLLLQVEAVLDAQKFPQAFERTRTFDPKKQLRVPAAPSLDEGMSPEAVEAAAGEVSTFQLYVITRRNTTWQGAVDWLDGSPRVAFDSVLELIKLTDEHLSHTKI